MGGTVYIWNLGFDWNAAPSGGTLSSGFVASGTSLLAYNPESGVAAGSQIGFWLFDLTATGVKQSPYTLSAWSVDVSPVSGTASGVVSPFSGSWQPFALPVPSASNASGTSPSFAGSYPYWTLVDKDGDPVYYTITSSGTGTFQLTFSATLGSGSATKSFEVDPEMIVTSTGGPVVDDDETVPGSLGPW